MTISLTDLAAVVVYATVRDKPVPVYGISAHGIAQLMRRFPEVRAALAERQIRSADILTFVPEVIAAIVAEALTDPDIDDAKERAAKLAEHEKVARKLMLGEQAEIIDKMFDATFPKGLGPFEALMAKFGVVRSSEANPAGVSGLNGSGATGKAQDTRSDLPLNG